MKTKMLSIRTALVTATIAGVLLCQSRGDIAQAQSPSTTAQAQSSVATDAAARLNKKEFSNVKVSVSDGVATLTGTVSLYQFKTDADKRIRKAKGVTSVRDLIEVAGPNLPDRELEAKLREKLTYDRVFYGNAFNAITLRVDNGAVTLGGHAVSLNSEASALSLVYNYPGVKDVTDKIEVDPLSMMDDHIRFAVFRAVYGFPSLNKYAIDPAKPIRISVQNGHVSLFGQVDSQSDKDMAALRANGVPGVFDVKNFLLVAN